MLAPFAFSVYFISLAVTSETVAPGPRTSALGSRPAAREDFGLESISQELPIAEPENRSFKSQVRNRAPKPAQSKRLGLPQADMRPAGKFLTPQKPELQKRPEVPHTNVKPALKFPIPRAMGPEPVRPKAPQDNAKPALKFPIPRAMGQRLPKISVDSKEPEDFKSDEAAAKFAPKAQKSQEWEGTQFLNITDRLGPALRQDNRDLKLKTLHLMEQCLYHTQDGNMLNVEEMATRYQMTKQYRMAFICLKLEELKNEMHSMFSYLFKNWVTYYSKNYWKYKIKVVTQIIYYTHLLKKNVDITYAVEYLLQNFSEM